MTMNNSRPLGIMAVSVAGARSPSDNWPGHLRWPGTFDFPVIEEIVGGQSLVERSLNADPTIAPLLVTAARRLAERGAVAIATNNGFFIRYQAEVAACVNVPVLTSSLLLLPTLLRQFPKSTKIGLLQLNHASVDEEMLGIENPEDRPRVVVGGTQGGIFWKNEKEGRETPLPVVESEVTAAAEKLKSEHRDIAAFVLNCSGFSCVAPSIRRTTGLPAYDLTALCRMTMASQAMSVASAS